MNATPLQAARDIAALVLTMDRQALDDWYEQSAGYRLSDDEPSLRQDLGAHRAVAAEMAFLHAMPEAAGVAEILGAAVRQGDLRRLA